MRVGGQWDASSRIERGCPRDFSVPSTRPMRSPPASGFRQGFGGGPQAHRRERDDSRSGGASVVGDEICSQRTEMFGCSVGVNRVDC
jgi:hypothetical protein